MKTNRMICMTESWDNIIKFNEKYFPGWRGIDEIYYSNALAGEVGEICNAVKHRAGGGTKEKKVSTTELMDEIADTFIYLELLIEKQYLDVTSLSDAINSKIKTNIERMEARNERGE